MQARLNKQEDDFTRIVEEMKQEEQLQKKLDLSFAQLSDRCKKLLEMIAQGKKSVDIVDALHMNTVNTVYRRKNACLQRWRALFKEI